MALLAAYPLYKKATPLIIEGTISNLILFFALTLISFWLVLRSGAKKNGNMLNAFLGSIALKLVVALAYFLIFLNDYKGFEIEFALTFFAAYLVCTGFEVYYLLNNLRQI